MKTSDTLHPLGDGIPDSWKTTAGGEKGTEISKSQEKMQRSSRYLRKTEDSAEKEGSSLEWYSSSVERTCLSKRTGSLGGSAGPRDPGAPPRKARRSAHCRWGVDLPVRGVLPHRELDLRFRAAPVGGLGGGGYYQEPLRTGSLVRAAMLCGGDRRAAAPEDSWALRGGHHGNRGGRWGCHRRPGSQAGKTRCSPFARGHPALVVAGGSDPAGLPRP